MADLAKFQSLVHMDSTILTDPVKIIASPYEGGPRAGFREGGWLIGWGDHVMGSELPVNKISSFENGWGAKAKGGFASGRNSRSEMKLISATGSDGGWEFQWMVKGSPSRHTSFKGGMGIACAITCYSGQAWAYFPVTSVVVVGIIDKVGGIQSVMGPENEAYTLITAHTPDHILSELKLSRLPFLKWSVVDNELDKWAKIKRKLGDLKTQILLDQSLSWKEGYIPLAGSIEDVLGYIPDDYPPEELNEDGFPSASNALDRMNQIQAMIDDITNHHPMGGFANYRDEWTATPGELMEYVKPNEYHFRYKITPQHNAFEICQNHVRANGEPLLHFFGSNFEPDVLTSYDSGVNVLDAGPGSVQQILQDSTAHGRFRYWWAADSTMHYENDYSNYNLAGGQLTSILDFVVGAGMSCTLKVTMTYDNVVINRVCVRGQWAAGNPDNPGDPLEGYFKNAQGSVYPAGRKLGDTDGSDIIMEDYQGVNTHEQAWRIFNQANCIITAEISNFPYALAAFCVFNKVVKITATDPLGAFSFSGAEFSCESASYQFQNYDSTGGGYATATMQLKEIQRSN